MDQQRQYLVGTLGFGDTSGFSRPRLPEVAVILTPQGTASPDPYIAPLGQHQVSEHGRAQYEPAAHSTWWQHL